MNMLKKFKEGLSKNVLFLGIVSGLTDISSEMLYPVIPIFISSVLNAPMSVVGLIEGVAESTASILKIYGGILSDKFKKRKLFVVLGYSLSSISKPIMALAYSWYFVLFARFIDRVGKGLRTSARDALIASSTSKEHYGKAFGFHRSMDTFGAALGPLVTMFLFYLMGESSTTYRHIFIIAFIPAILGVLFLIYNVKENINVQEIKNGIKEKEKLSNDFKIFTIIYIIFAIGNSSDAFLILRTKSLGFSMSEVILVYFTYNIIYAFMAMPAGIISDKIGKYKTFIAGLFIFSIVYYGFAINNNTKLVWVLFAVYGFYGALNEGIYKSIISIMTTEKNRATAMGIFQGLGGIAIFIASFLAGILWDKFSYKATFYLGAITSFLSMILFIIWRLKNEYIKRNS